MRSWICLTAALSALMSLPASAQTFPERPITLIVPFAAGGGADAVGRVIARGNERSSSNNPS